MMIGLPLSVCGVAMDVLTAAIRGMFAGGAVPGVFLDANDWGTSGTNGTGVVVQDNAGAFVTAMEQPVQLILDKSKGLAVGAEMLANGNFASGSSWVQTGTGWTISGGKATCNGVSGNEFLYQTNARPDAFGVYQVVVTISNYTSGSLNVSLSNGANNTKAFTAAGTYVVTAFSPGAVGSASFYLHSTNFAGSVSLVSLKPIAGNHAYVGASANRCLISARYNQLISTENLAIAPWGTNQLTVTPSVAAPDGTSTAFRLVPSTSGGNTHYLGQTISKAATALAYTDAWIVKSAGYDVRVLIDDATSGSASTGQGASMDVNLTTGEVINAAATYGSGFTSASGTVSALGNGWYLIVLKVTSSTATSVRSAVYAYNGGVVFAGDGTKGVDVWHPDFRPSDQANGLIPPYQKVTTGTDYDWSPAFPPIIKGNGTNQYLTGNMDLSSTNKVTIWAGVRKFSDTAGGILMEFSNNVNTNAGSFVIAAPESAAIRYRFTANIASSVSAPYTTDNSYLSPVTNTLSLQIASGLANVPKINGVSPAGFNAGALCGVGTMGNYPYYLLSRAGSSIFMNGGFNSIVVAGKAANDSEIIGGQQFANMKIKAYA